MIPTVLVTIDKNSRLEILQDAGVQVAFVDERIRPLDVILLPQQNQAQLINERLADKYPVSTTSDLGGVAANAVRQFQTRSIITTGLKADKEAP
jgi:hypothetical protein